MVSKVSGSWTVSMLGKTLTFVLRHGKLTVEGEHFELMPAEKKEYPVADGWFRYAPDTFINISPTGIKVAAMVGWTKVPITVKDSEPVPNTSMYLFSLHSI